MFIKYAHTFYAESSNIPRTKIIRASRVRGVSVLLMSRSICLHWRSLIITDAVTQSHKLFTRINRFPQSVPITGHGGITLIGLLKDALVGGQSRCKWKVYSWRVRLPRRGRNRKRAYRVLAVVWLFSLRYRAAARRDRLTDTQRDETAFLLNGEKNAVVVTSTFFSRVRERKRDKMCMWFQVRHCIKSCYYLPVYTGFLTVLLSQSFHMIRKVDNSYFIQTNEYCRLFLSVAICRTNMEDCWKTYKAETNVSLSGSYYRSLLETPFKWDIQIWFQS